MPGGAAMKYRDGVTGLACATPSLPPRTREGHASGGCPRMKGSICRCGFATTATRPRCPRCGKRMKSAYWPNQGTVSAFVRIGVTAEGHEFPTNLLMVQVPDGPKIACLTDTAFSVGDSVTFVQLDEGYICSPTCDIEDLVSAEKASEDDLGDADE